MGAHSTLSITREDAIKELYSKMRFEEMSDEEIENILYSLLGDKTLYNFKIVSEYNSDGYYEYRKGEFDNI